jgi:hypothetical protein
MSAISSQPPVGRQIHVKGMSYAPTSEQGVVALFGILAPRLGFCVESVQTRCPDCWAMRRGKRYRIEFEFWASAFLQHRHNPNNCDMIVCWENDWADRPKRFRGLEIVSLKEYVNAGRRVFVVGADSERALAIRGRRIEWNVPSAAQVCDLVLVYRAQPASAICDLWEITGPFKNYDEQNPQRRNPGLQTWMRHVVSFETPLLYSDLANDHRTRGLAVVRKRFQGKTDITDDWPLIHDKIVELNPGTRRVLQPFS